MSKLTGRPLDWAITCAAGSGFLLFGYDQGVMSGLLTGNAFTTQFPEIDTTEGGAGGSASLQGTVVAIYEIGCFFGAVLAFFCAEKLGRRRSVLLGCAILIVGAVVQVTAYGIPQMIVGMIVAGVGNGLNTATIPVWHSELMKPTSRGRGLSIELAINIFGVMLSYWTDYGMSYVQNQAQFRFPIAFQIVFALATIALINFLPESPRWYAPVIFESSVGLPRNTSLLLAGFLGVVFFVSSLVPIWCLDKFGRRRLMLFAAAGQTVCMAVLAGTVSNGNQASGIVACVMLFLFDFFFAVGLLAIPWLLPAEYAPLAIRTQAAALATMSNWIFTFLVVEITPVSIQSIGWRTYVYFGVFNAAFLPLIYLYYPEVRNLSLEQIDHLFTGDKVLLHWQPSMGERQGSFALDTVPANEETASTPEPSKEKAEARYVE